MIRAVSDASSPSSGPALPAATERLALAALALAAFALNLNTNVLGALLPFVPAELAAHDTSLLAAAAGGSALGALAVLPLAARGGRRRALLGGLFAFVVASALHLVTTDYWPLLALRAVSGIAVGVAYAAASALVAEIVPYARRGAAMGVFTAGMFLAIPIGMPLAVALANAGHWQWIFGAQAAIGGLGLWWSLRAVPETGGRDVPGGFAKVLTNGPAVAGLVATMLHVGSFFVTVQLATTWLAATGRVPKDDQMWLWIGLGAASVVGSALLGRVSDAVGKKNFVLATSAVLVGCFLFLTREPEAMALLLAGGLLAVCASARTGPLQALVSGLVEKQHLAALMAWRGCTMQLGVAAFALAAKPIAAELGFRGVLFLAAGCQGASYLAIRMFGREGK
jgi:MFS transporter, DHA1 family, inner membrane transport protein